MGDRVIVGDRTATECDSSLDASQPEDPGTMTNFVEIGQVRDRILSLKLDQVNAITSKFTTVLVCCIADLGHVDQLWPRHLG